MLALILLTLFIVAFYTPNFEIKLRIGNKQILFSIGNTTESSESEDQGEEIIINNSNLSGAFDFNVNGKLTNNV
jgi:hypothetical protein